MRTTPTHASRPSGALRLGAATFASLALSGCVPSRWEGSTAVLVVTPLVLLVVYAVLYALLRFGRWPLPTRRHLFGPPVIVAVLSLAIGLVALAHPPERSDAVEWMGPAFVFYGSSFLSVFLLVFRAAAALVPERAVDVAIGTTSVAMLAPALLGFVQAFGTIMRVNVADPGALFAGDFLASPQTVVLTGLRIQLLPILFVNAHYSRSYRITRSPGSEYHLGNEKVVDADGRASPYFKTDTLYQNVQTLFVELELGWELNRDRGADTDTPAPPDPNDRLGEPADAEGH